MRIRQIKTEKKVVGGQLTTVPVLDEQGQEIELWAVDVPREVEAEGLPKDLDYTDQAAVETAIASTTARLKRAREAKEQQLLEDARVQAAADAEATAQLNQEG